MNLTEAQNYLCSKLNITASDVINGNNALFSLTDINGYIQNAVKRAWDYKPWTFTQKTYTFVIPNPFPGYVDYPNTFEDDSADRLENTPPGTLGEFTKRNFADYQKFFADYPTDNSALWCEHERFIFINANIAIPGTSFDISGKLRSTPPLNATDLLPFSPMTDSQENSGNAAICILAYADALSSEKKKNPTQAALEEKRAIAILDAVWKPMGERRAKEQSQNRQFFTGQDFFGVRRTPYNTNI